MIRFILNDKEVAVKLPPGTALLDFIRYQQGLTGTKIGCREGDCGACTVLVGEIINDELLYKSMTSCLMPIGNAKGKHIVTIEGINFPDELNPLQQAMADYGATQCGFCTPGFVMSLAGFCLSDKKPTEQNAIAALDGNICRCTGYKSIEKAAGKVAAIMYERNGEEITSFVARRKILPGYFAGIKARLQALITLRQAQGDISFQNNGSIVGGGTDLYVQKHEEMVHADIRFVFDEPAMNGITEEDNKCVIGPSVTVSDLKNSSFFNKVFPDFQRYSKLVSSTPIRNMATIAGNFVNASPIGDLTIFFLALDAQIDLCQTSLEGESLRTVPLREFYKEYKQLDKKPEEIISKIWFEIPDKGSYFNFEKVSKRTHLDIASVNSAMLITINGNEIVKAGLSAGGVGPVPVFLKKTSWYLIGQKINEETIYGAIEAMKTEISPISDARGSKEYKTLLLGQLIRAHFLAVFS
ncbi:MAG TPA: FAD binding domain-containing protein [Chitinophagaceae bacterium]|nr:FAD binding domain-containing protein [Chitinophagaceae bacterium]